MFTSIYKFHIKQFKERNIVSIFIYTCVIETKKNRYNIIQFYFIKFNYNHKFKLLIYKTYVLMNLIFNDYEILFYFK